MSTVAGPAESEAVTVPIRKVEAEFNRQLKAMQGPGVAPVVRSGLSNLVIYCNNQSLVESVEAIVPEIVAIHPARILLLAHEPAGDSPEITATVHSRMHKFAQGHRVFSEQVTLHAEGRAVEHLTYAVRSLLIGDLPTNLWWAASVPPALAGSLLYDLSEHADQVLYDSYGWPEPAKGMMATGSWLDRFERVPGQGPYRVVSDLTWRRLRTWRRLVSQVLDPDSVPGALDSITEVDLDHGPHSVMSAWSLASWLAYCLGWKGVGAKVQTGTEIHWQFQCAQGPRTVRLRRLADAPRGIQLVRISCRIQNVLSSFVITPEDDGRRLSALLEDGNAAPRTLTDAPQPLAELVGRQLSDRERDPIFHKTMLVAQSLAQIVLGG